MKPLVTPETGMARRDLHFMPVHMVAGVSTYIKTHQSLANLETLIKRKLPYYFFLENAVLDFCRQFERINVKIFTKS
jgi:hypothetical protein